MSDYLVGLESSGWLRHIKAIVDAAVFLTKVIFLFLCVLISSDIRVIFIHMYVIFFFFLNSCVLPSRL